MTVNRSESPKQSKKDCSQNDGGSRSEGQSGGGSGVSQVAAGQKVLSFFGRGVAAKGTAPIATATATAERIAAAPAALDLERLSVAAARGDREAFRTMVDVTGGRLYSLANHLLGDAAEANDAVQEAYLRAYLNLGRFQPRGAGACLAWLRRITLNVCRDWLRTKRPAPLGDLEPYVSRDGSTGGLAGTWSTSDAADPFESLALDDEDVRQAVRALPVMYREVVVLRYGHDLSYSEIARTLGEGENTVATRLRRALIMLRKGLSERGERS